MDSKKYLNKEEILINLSNIDEGYKDLSDGLFITCNKLEKPFKKLGVITLIDENDLHSKHSISCNILGCDQVFDTVFEFESHYNSLHRYLCSTCKKNLPSAHLLDLHVSESHDSFFAAQSERKPMFSCFLAACSHKSLNIEERKDHCIKKHKFPANFRFDTSSSIELHNDKIDGNMDHSKQTKIPTNKNDEKNNRIKVNHFSFGHQRTKSFNSIKKSRNKTVKNKSNIEMEISPLDDEQMVTDLLESLPDVKS